MLKVIGKKIVRKTIEMIKKLADPTDDEDDEEGDKETEDKKGISNIFINLFRYIKRRRIR